MKLELLISKEKQFPAARTVPAASAPSRAQVRPHVGKDSVWQQKPQLTLNLENYLPQT